MRKSIFQLSLVILMSGILILGELLNLILVDSIILAIGVMIIITTFLITEIFFRIQRNIDSKYSKFSKNILEINKNPEKIQNMFNLQNEINKDIYSTLQKISKKGNKK